MNEGWGRIWVNGVAASKSREWRRTGEPRAAINVPIAHDFELSTFPSAYRFQMKTKNVGGDA